jgi:hypothetical protein
MSKPKRAVYVATVKRHHKGKTYVSHLLRHTYRDGDKVKQLTLGTLTDLPEDLIELIRRRLNSKEPLDVGEQGFEVARSLPHGHVAAVIGTMRKIGVDKLVCSTACREARIILALLALRFISPGSKLAHLNALRADTAQNTLARELGLEEMETAEVYEALDWLLKRQPRIENKLAKRHLHEGTLLLYDVSSSYYTGRESGLIRHGYSRDGKPAEPQIVYGLLCTPEGCPVAVEVFPGNTADPTTFTAQVARVRERFGLRRVVLVGDRGMITSARIDADLRGVEGLDWITALRNDSIQQLARQTIVQPSLFDERDLAEVTSEDFPGERLIVCRNPLLADERARKRTELLAVAQRKLDAIVRAVSRAKQPLRGKEKIGLRVGRELKNTKMLKHFELTIADDAFSYRLRDDEIAREAATDGIYVIRTSVSRDALSAEQAVAGYKGLSQVEWAFRSLKTTQLELRPIYHWKDDRIRAHVFLCMLAYYVEWHMRRALAPLSFKDHDRAAAEAARASIVRQAPRSEAAVSKDRTHQTHDGLRVQSFRSLLKDLGTICRLTIRVGGHADATFERITLPTELQQRVFELLGVSIDTAK